MQCSALLNNGSEVLTPALTLAPTLPPGQSFCVFCFVLFFLANLGRYLGTPPFGRLYLGAYIWWGRQMGRRYLAAAKSAAPSFLPPYIGRRQNGRLIKCAFISARRHSGWRPAKLASKQASQLELGLALYLVVSHRVCLSACHTL